MKASLFLCVGVSLQLAMPPIYAQSAPSPSPAVANMPAEGQSADQAWAHIKELEKDDSLKPLQAALTDFVARFPNDSRRYEAKLENAQIEYNVAKMTGSPANPKAITDVCTEIVAAKDAPDELRRDARFLLLQGDLEKGADEKLQSKVAEFCKDYPGNSMGAMLQLTVAKKLRDPAKAHALLEELAKSSDEETALLAKVELHFEQLRGKPLELKFTAVDGSEVDLAKLKGKVVLVDFWATWCGPCMMEAHHVVEAYKKLHDKGFEVIGVSLDQKKDIMLKVTKAGGMTWPQYFDGKGWENEISSKFGIKIIPAMWLVNKKGILVNTDASEDLEGSIEKLLGE